MSSHLELNPTPCAALKTSVHLQPESYGATGLVGEGTYEKTVFLGPEDRML